ncbi:XRE family transcriptional regulator [Pelagibacterium montanilacus]|uniref:XRE family transcriptional regulator n=1 Tax=Pelagibacterium montanilacus TaxID=2185280 RepID=UPI000F8ECDAB|nr:S24 family peptidase [Pelagibacterium montanilacus]
MSETLITRIESRLTQLKLSPRAASLSVSSNPDLIRGILRKGDRANPTSETINLIARALGVQREWLLWGTGDGESHIPPAAKSDEFSPADVPYPMAQQMRQDIPVLGTAAGTLIHPEDNGKEVEGFQIEGSVIQYVRRPPALEHVKDAYAILVEGDSMAPRHNPGELRFVHPLHPAAPGDTVIVQTRSWNDDPGQAYIKIYRRRTADKILLEQLNPACTIEIPLKFVTAVHRVMDLNELFGI